jgi:hypothetical protein
MAVYAQNTRVWFAPHGEPGARQDVLLSSTQHEPRIALHLMIAAPNVQGLLTQVILKWQSSHSAFASLISQALAARTSEARKPRVLVFMVTLLCR